jgi:hypothetical protein
MLICLGRLRVPSTGLNYRKVGSFPRKAHNATSREHGMFVTKSFSERVAIRLLGVETWGDSDDWSLGDPMSPNGVNAIFVEEYMLDTLCLLIGPHPFETEACDRAVTPWIIGYTDLNVW